MVNFSIILLEPYQDYSCSKWITIIMLIKQIIWALFTVYLSIIAFYKYDTIMGAL